VLLQGHGFRYADYALKHQWSPYSPHTREAYPCIKTAHR